MKFFSTVLPDDNVVHITRLLLRELNVKVTDTAVRDTILSNPHHPSLLSISDSLRGWQLDTLAVKTSIEKLQDVPCPCIVHINANPGNFLIVRKITDTTVTYLTDQNDELQMSLDEFANTWNGHVLIIEKKPESGQENYESQKRKEYWRNHRISWAIAVLLLIGLIQLLQFILNENNSAASSIYVAGSFLINYAGMAVTSILLWYEYDMENPFIKKFCSVSATANCASVLFSKGGKLFNLASWSEIGFVYFTGAFFYHVFAMNSFYWLAIVSLPAAAYIIYSLAYQAFVIKQWCMLCLTIQALLLMHLLLGITTQQVQQALANTGNIINVTILPAYAIPILLWLILKPYLYETREKKVLEKQLAKIKNNEEIFDQLLQLQIPMKTFPTSMGIIMGDPNAANTIVKVCSPYCEPCANSYPNVDRLLNKDNWKVQVIFTTGAKKNDRNSQAAAYLLRKATDGSHSGKEILSHWYAVERHNAALPTSDEEAEKNVRQHAAHLQAMYNWCVQENIQVTPTIYVNGHRLPEQYGVPDLYLF